MNDVEYIIDSFYRWLLQPGLGGWPVWQGLLLAWIVIAVVAVCFVKGANRDD